MKNWTLNLGLLNVAFFIMAGTFSAADAFTLIKNNPELVLIGKVQEKITTVNGITSGVIVDIGSGTQATGDLNFTLDPSKNSFFEYDFDTGTILEELYLLVTFQLQADLGQPPVKISINESGTITQVTQTPTQPGDILADVTSSGFITPPSGSPLSSNGSWTGTALQPTLTPSDTPLGFTILSKLNGGGIVQEGLFTGFAWNNFQDKSNINVQIGKNNNTQKTPEPTSTLSLFALGTLGAASTLKRKLKSSKSSEKETTKVS
jgi:hypothetical protein